MDESNPEPATVSVLPAGPLEGDSVIDAFPELELLGDGSGVLSCFSTVKETDAFAADPTSSAVIVCGPGAADFGMATSALAEPLEEVMIVLSVCCGVSK